MKINIQDVLKIKYQKAKVLGLILIISLFVTVFIAINLGKADLSFISVGKIILTKITGNSSYLEGIKESEVAILWEIRFPRILTAVIVGSGLAISGAVFQALLMNPLADSYTMGVSSGAAFGASIAIYLNLFISGFNLPITLCAFLGAFLTLGIVMKIANIRGYVSSSNLVIAGIIVSSILASGISFLKSASGEQVAAIINWLIGSLSARSWQDVTMSFPLILICALICIYYAEDLNVLSLGEEESRALGVDTTKIRKILLISGSLITAICVSVSGIIGFIGLIVPHMLRILLGSDNKFLLPLSFLLGGELLLLADTGARAFMNVEVPVGVLTTLLGGPFFIYIFVKKNRSLQ